MQPLSGQIYDVQAWPCNPLVKHASSKYGSQRCQNQRCQKNYLVQLTAASIICSYCYVIFGDTTILHKGEIKYSSIQCVMYIVKSEQVATTTHHVHSLYRHVLATTCRLQFSCMWSPHRHLPIGSRFQVLTGF